jgi:hypothetical protein
MSEQLVVMAAIVEAVALVLGVGLIVGHGAALAFREHTSERQLAEARSALVKLLSRGEPGTEPIAVALFGLPRSAKLRLLADFAPSVSGEDRQRLRDAAERAGLLKRPVRDCRARDWKRRLRGVRVLTVLGSGSEQVERLFDDPRPEVRAQAAEWAAEHPRPEVIRRLLDMLGDEETLCRFTVRDSLVRIGRLAVPELAERLQQARGADAARLLEVAVWRPDVCFLDSAQALALDELPETRALALKLLGAIGGQAVATALARGLEDPGPAVRAAAARALGQAHQWQAAPRLADALHDPEWDVRHGAGMALRRLGGPGEVMLRKMTRDPDPNAGDIARLVLELPEPVGAST